ADDLALQLVQASAFECADGDDGRTGDIEKRAADKVFNLHLHHAERVFIYEIGFGDNSDTARNGEQTADFKVLTALGLDGFIGGDHHQNQVHATDASQHVAHETLVARYVYEAKPELGFVLVASLHTACEFLRLNIVLRLIRSRSPRGRAPTPPRENRAR